MLGKCLVIILGYARGKALASTERSMRRTRHGCGTVARARDFDTVLAEPLALSRMQPSALLGCSCQWLARESRGSALYSSEVGTCPCRDGAPLLLPLPLPRRATSMGTLTCSSPEAFLPPFESVFVSHSSPASPVLSYPILPAGSGHVMSSR